MDWQPIRDLPLHMWVEIIAFPNPQKPVRSIAFDPTYIRTVTLQDGRRPTHFRINNADLPSLS